MGQFTDDPGTSEMGMFLLGYRPEGLMVKVTITACYNEPSQTIGAYLEM